MRLKDLLKGSVPDDALSRFSGHFDVIGDIAIVTIPPELTAYKKIIAETILAGRKNIYTVLNKVQKVRSDARTASYEVLVGDTTITRYREFGFQYRFDVTKVFFNSHLAYERMRVTEQVEPGERVLVPFCGIGPFAIPAAARGARVVAIEQNPEAYAWLRENIALNHVRDAITPINGDARDTSHLAQQRFDRIIIPTPYGMDGILDTLAPYAGRDGMIHFYTFRAANEIPALVDEFTTRGFEITFQNTCGNVAPGIKRWAFDLVKKG
ncbi:RsmD family RNA methyltransferase [Methanoregula sp.]|uniref:class I SAM-dependent methyltransferase n=1 Tax=Methanoregula sp. TaxID=2052170 RepID=UPI00236D79D7|nr:RsmD family RNA methyltransferase [Methanoregula sp.]MDD1685849.1 RsmD family RNA methyltransferase [Methanoregula sp.]